MEARSAKATVTSRAIAVGGDLIAPEAMAPTQA
jgi:hypothetical protein